MELHVTGALELESQNLKIRQLLPEPGGFLPSWDLLLGHTRWEELTAALRQPLSFSGTLAFLSDEFLFQEGPSRHL